MPLPELIKERAEGEQFKKFWNEFAQNNFDLGTNEPDNLPNVLVAKAEVKVYLDETIALVLEAVREWVLSNTEKGDSWQLHPHAVSSEELLALLSQSLTQLKDE